jgi:hypothetical protein
MPADYRMPAVALANPIGVKKVEIIFMGRLLGW